MGTVREYFDTDAIALNAQSEWLIKKNDLEATIVIGKISYCFEENAKYWSFYIPGNLNFDIVKYILHMPNVAMCIISEDEPNQIVGYADNPERHNLDSHVFTGRVYLYIEDKVTIESKRIIENIGTQLGLNVVIRDEEYVNCCEQLSKPVAFISHDSRDKDELVRELAKHLAVKLRKVWYDEYSLKPGDSLRENIERGLKECEKCIVILSSNFLSNGGWTRAEFDSIFSREILEKKLIMIPVWHKVTKEQVYEYCPRLVDRVALNSSLGEIELANELAKVLTN